MFRLRPDGAAPQPRVAARECDAAGRLQPPAPPPVPPECRAPSSSPCSFAAATVLIIAAAPRAEKPPVLLDLVAGARPPLGEPRRLPHLKLVAKPDKSDLMGKAGMGTKRLRKDDASILIDGQDLHIAVERNRQLVALVRIVRQACQKPIALLPKSVAASIDGRSIQRGVAVDAAGVAVALEDGAERGRDGHAALGVNLVRECRDKAVHPQLETSADAQLPSPEPPSAGCPKCASLPAPEKWDVAVAQPRALFEAGATATVPCPVRTGTHGITWKIMGVNWS